MFPKLIRDEYSQGVKRGWSPLEASLIMTSQKSEYYEGVLKTPTDGLANIFKRTDHVWFFEDARLKEMSNLVFSEWLDAAAFENTQKELLVRERDLLDAIDLDLGGFLQVYRKYTPAIFAIWRADEPVASAVAERIRAKTTSEEADALIEALKVPLQNNLYKQEEYELIHAQDLEAHAQKFRWIYSRYGERSAYTAEEAAEKLKNIDRKEYLEKYEKEKNHVRQAISRAKELLDPQEKHLVDVLQFILYYRTQRTDVMFLVMNQYLPRLEEYAKIKGLTAEEAMYCHVDELLGDAPSKDLLHQRMQKQAFGFQGGVFEVFTDTDADAIDIFFTDNVVLTEIIKGQVACKGVVRGRVIVFRSKDDMERVQEGDILVASMTNPNHLPAMKRAAAFVTDEGGVTCHAAIVSRELGKPCIIGTKIATKVLKDGDEVEVDAEKGIVKKLL